MIFEIKSATATAIDTVRCEMKVSKVEGRSFKGLSSTWDLDLGGDVITRGAFQASLSRWQASGERIPLIDSHHYGSVLNVLGWVNDAKETPEGLDTQFEAFDDEPGNRMLDRVRRRVVSGLSIGYIPIKTRLPDERLRTLGVRRILDELELREVSLVLSPMNPQARVTSPDGKALEIELADRAERRKRFDETLANYHAEQAAERAERAERLAALKVTQAELSRSDWQPDDPKRIELAAKLRGIKLRMLRSRLTVEAPL